MGLQHYPFPFLSFFSYSFSFYPFFAAVSNIDPLPRSPLLPHSLISQAFPPLNSPPKTWNFPWLIFAWVQLLFRTSRPSEGSRESSPVYEQSRGLESMVWVCRGVLQVAPRQASPCIIHAGTCRSCPTCTSCAFYSSSSTSEESWRSPWMDSWYFSWTWTWVAV